MTDIEKRAWEKYPEVIKHHNLAHIDINEEARDMYIEAATEQKAIDDRLIMQERENGELLAYNCEKRLKKELIDKACNYLKNLKSWNHYDDEECDLMSVEDIEKFRRAMEEE